MTRLVVLDPSSPVYASLRQRILTREIDRLALKCKRPTAELKESVPMEFLSNNGGIIIHTAPRGSADGRIKAGTNPERTDFDLTIHFSDGTRRVISASGRHDAFRLHSHLFNRCRDLDPSEVDKLLRKI